MQAAEERANEMLRAAGGSMAVWSQRNALIRMVLAEDKVAELEAENERYREHQRIMTKALDEIDEALGAIFALTRTEMKVAATVNWTRKALAALED